MSPKVFWNFAEQDSPKLPNFAKKLLRIPAPSIRLNTHVTSQ